MRVQLPHLALSALLALGGCATQTSLYHWGPYEDQVYAHFKNESPEQQILVLEKHVQEAAAKDRQLPPGFRAHLGLLYAKVGREEDFLMALQQEMAAFPESAPYVNSLLARAKGRSESRDDKK